MDQAWDMAMSSVLALSIGGVSAVLGLWVGRDKSRPVSFAVLMTVLILSAVGVGVVQSVLDAEDAIKKQADLDRMVETVTEIAIASGDEELAKLIESQTGVKVDIPEEVAAAEPAEGSDTGAAEDGEGSGDEATDEGAADDGAAAEGDAAEGDATDGSATEGDAAEAVPAEGDGASTDTPDGADAPAAQ
ncbi:MAG: hypothetical protein H6742_03695 [Alphaproteobacteria bacterium]|nr:hypothetical protein [Alphaproteobacteria bacterium]